MSSPFAMTPVGELVAAGFERARVIRHLRRQADVARRWVAAERIDPEAGALFARWCEALVETVEARLFDDDIEVGA